MKYFLSALIISMSLVCAAQTKSTTPPKAAPKKKPMQQFFFKEYEVYKAEKEKFDSVALWYGAKSIKKLKLPGYINLNRTAREENWSIVVRYKEDAGEDIKYSVLTADWERHWAMLNGNRLFYVNTPEEGEYMALYQYAEGYWIIYRKTIPKPSLKSVAAKRS